MVVFSTAPMPCNINGDWHCCLSISFRNAYFYYPMMGGWMDEMAIVSSHVPSATSFVQVCKGLVSRQLVQTRDHVVKEIAWHSPRSRFSKTSDEVLNDSWLPSSFRLIHTRELSGSRSNRCFTLIVFPRIQYHSLPNNGVSLR